MKYLTLEIAAGHIATYCDIPLIYVSFYHGIQNKRGPQNLLVPVSIVYCLILSILFCHTFFQLIGII